MNHLTFFDSSGAILVELTEALVEVFIIESGAVRHVRKRISDELLGLVFVKVTIAVSVVLGPDLVHTLGDDVVNFRVSLGHGKKLFLLKKIIIVTTLIAAYSKIAT